MKNSIQKELNDIIHARLQEAFSPSYLEIIDDSAKHVGHQGSLNGGKHFTVKIEAACLTDLSRIAAHRKIYSVLEDLMPHPIHALCIEISHKKSELDS